MHQPAIDRRSLMMHRLIAERLRANTEAAERHKMNSRGRKPTDQKPDGPSRVSGATMVPVAPRPQIVSDIPMVSPRRGSGLHRIPDRGLSPTAIHIAPLRGSDARIR